MYKRVRFVIFVPFIKCDTEEGDMLCGKYKVRTRNIKNICRYCKCPTDKSDDPRLTYDMKTQMGIQRLIDRKDLQALKNISQHSIRNAWYPVRFHAANLRGVHGACPSEMLHAILLGIFKYTRATFFEHMGETSKLAEDINGLAKMYGVLLTRQSDRSLPNTNFSKGTQKGKLMGKEHRGVLLVMAALVRSTKGRKLMGKKMGGEDGMTDWSVLVELLLEWEAYLCLKKMKKRDVKKLKKKHVFIMYMLRNVARRYKGMGLKIMKFHAIKHMVEDMLLYGTPSEFDTGSNESHHKSSKYAAKLTQRKESTFNFQTAMRMTEFLVLDLALCEIEHGKCLWEYFGADLEAPLEDVSAQLEALLRLELGNQLNLDDQGNNVESEGEEEVDGEESGEDDLSFRNLNYQDSDSEADEQEEEQQEQHDEEEANDEEPEPDADAMEQDAPTTVVVTGGTKIRMDFNEEDDSPSFTMVTRSKAMKQTKSWNPEIVDFLHELQDLVADCIPTDWLPVYTMHKRNDTIFHGHPNYRNLGYWRDWAQVDWGSEGKLPCHIWCFVELENMPEGRGRLSFGGITLKDGVYAVVEAASYDNPQTTDKMTDLFTPITLWVEGMDKDGKVTGREFFLADTEAIVGTCIVVPDIGGPTNAYFEVRPRSEWAETFLKWLKRPHVEDEMIWTSDEEAAKRDAAEEAKREARRKEKQAKNRQKKAAQKKK